MPLLWTNIVLILALAVVVLMIGDILVHHRPGGGLPLQPWLAAPIAKPAPVDRRPRSGGQLLHVAANALQDRL